MTTIHDWASGIKGAIVSTPFIGGGIALIGYFYGRFAHLPAREVAKAWAIWAIAENAFLHLTDIFTKNSPKQALIHAIVLIGGTAIALPTLYKQGLIGQKMMYAIIVIKSLAALILIKTPMRLFEETKK